MLYCFFVQYFELLVRSQVLQQPEGSAELVGQVAARNLTAVELAIFNVDYRGSYINAHIRWPTINWQEYHDSGENLCILRMGKMICSVPVLLRLQVAVNIAALRQPFGVSLASACKLMQEPQEKSGVFKTEPMDIIRDKVPREVVGRNTISRFRMQFQAAAYAALEILSGKEVDLVYCDYHDDFVVRRTVSGGVEYHFFQVKTKGKANQQWDVDEVFALKKKGELDTAEKLEAIRNSIAGKLFLHTIEFGDQCREVTILSNVHFKDEVHDVVADLSAGTSSKKYIRQLIEKFAEIVSPDSQLSDSQVEGARKKLSLLANVQHISDTLEAFGIAAHNAIWRHSEIELRQDEVERIARSLVALVEEKSCAPIRGLNKTDIDLATSVGLEDLLKVLSISTQVYQTLLQGGDPAAIKAASVLQRTLKEVGATDSMIEAASRAKVSWDVWVRTARHTFPDLTFNILLEEIDKACKAWLLGGGALADLEDFSQKVLGSAIGQKISSLNIDLVFGAFCAAIVRRATR